MKDRIQWRQVQGSIDVNVKFGVRLAREVGEDNEWVRMMTNLPLPIQLTAIGRYQPPSLTPCQPCHNLTEK